LLLTDKKKHLIYLLNIGKVRTGQHQSERVRTSQNGSELIRKDQKGIERIRKDQNGSERIRTDQNGSERIRTDQNGSERVITCNDKDAILNKSMMKSINGPEHAMITILVAVLWFRIRWICN
jgi:hypothetical protein